MMSCVGPVMELGVTMLPAPGCGRDHRTGRLCEDRDTATSRLSHTSNYNGSHSHTMHRS